MMIKKCIAIVAVTVVAGLFYVPCAQAQNYKSAPAASGGYSVYGDAGQVPEGYSSRSTERFRAYKDITSGRKRKLVKRTRVNGELRRENKERASKGMPPLSLDEYMAQTNKAEKYMLLHPGVSPGGRSQVIRQENTTPQRAPVSGGASPLSIYLNGF